MKINIPSIDGNNQFIKENQSIVLIGANGSGKTRMSVWIENNNTDKNVHRISAQKSLTMPNNVSPKDIEVAINELYYGYSYDNDRMLSKREKNKNRWQRRPETAMLNDFDKLLTYLVTEDYQKSIEFRQRHIDGDSDFTNTTKLDLIKSIWEDVITHRKLSIKAGKIETCKLDEGKFYSSSEMSDGERAIFYFIGEVLAAPDNSIVIIDEPENHLHKSILIKLWNRIEDFRKDCLFVYITHNLDFAISRLNSEIVWVKEYCGKDKWDYEIIDNEEGIPESLILEMIGSRRNILFVEGKKDSYDFKLYSELFKEYTVIPLQSCQNVIQSTKSFNQLSKLHNLNAKGIIDRDRKSDEMIESYKLQNIYSALVSEVENFFLIPEVVEQLMKYLLKNEDERKHTINSMKIEIVNFLNKHKEEQALLFTKQTTQNKFNEILSCKSVNINDYENNIKGLHDNTTVRDIYSQFIFQIEEIIKNKDYIGALKIINNKGLLPECGILSDLAMKKNSYIDTIIKLIRSDKEEGIIIRDILKDYITID